jgi:hypothetical protein
MGVFRNSFLDIPAGFELSCVHIYLQVNRFRHYWRRRCGVMTADVHPSVGSNNTF